MNLRHKFITNMYFFFFYQSKFCIIKHSYKINSVFVVRFTHLTVPIIFWHSFQFLWQTVKVKTLVAAIAYQNLTVLILTDHMALLTPILIFCIFSQTATRVFMLIFILFFFFFLLLLLFIVLMSVFTAVEHKILCIKGTVCIRCNSTFVVVRHFTVINFAPKTTSQLCTVFAHNLVATLNLCLDIFKTPILL